MTPRADADLVNSPSQKILIPPPGFCKPIERVAPGDEVGTWFSTAGDGPGTAMSDGVRLKSRFRAIQGWIHPLTRIPDDIFDFHEIALVRSTLPTVGRHDLDAQERPWFQMLDL
jgi:hypothetical protein